MQHTHPARGFKKNHKPRRFAAEQSKAGHAPVHSALIHLYSTID
jgi:hypothetical protein